MKQTVWNERICCIVELICWSRFFSISIHPVRFRSLALFLACYCWVGCRWRGQYTKEEEIRLVSNQASPWTSRRQTWAPSLDSCTPGWRSWCRRGRSWARPCCWPSTCASWCWLCREPKSGKSCLCADPPTSCSAHRRPRIEHRPSAASWSMCPIGRLIGKENLITTSRWSGDSIRNEETRHSLLALIESSTALLGSRWTTIICVAFGLNP